MKSLRLGLWCLVVGLLGTSGGCAGNDGATDPLLPSGGATSATGGAPLGGGPTGGMAMGGVATGGVAMGGTGGAAVCGAGQFLCGSLCVTLTTDSLNCGACGTACAPGSSCQGGICACSSGTNCGGLCVDTATNPIHCGTCANGCGAGQSCTTGLCQCQGGLTSCPDGCVNVLASGTNCGTCGYACPSGQVCSQGTCQVGGCATGELQCGQSCVLPATDALNCGACDIACPAGASCVAGSCACSAGTLCGDACVDTSTDPFHCGACGNACSGGRSCAGSACICAVGRTFCTDACVDTESDAANCGACGMACSASAGCTAGACGAGTGGAGTGGAGTGGAGTGGAGTGGTETGGATTGGTATGGATTGGTATGGATTGGTATGGTATGGSGSCVDEPPPNGDTCAHALEWSWCGATWMNGACALSCGLCTGTGGAGGTGGVATGGVATGGVATGGVATGGVPTGGVATGGVAMGGVATGGVPTGGVATGGVPTGGSATGGTTGGWYPCDGNTAGYNAVMTKSGSTWTVVNGGSQRYSGSDMQAALVAAYGSLTSGRTSKQSILVQGDGDIPATAQVGIPSYTILNVCGTLNVSGTPSGSDRSPLYARGRTNIDIPNLKMTGSPQYGIFIRESNNVHLGQIDLRLTSSAGIGIRADSGSSAGSMTTFNTGFAIDYVYGSGMGSHVVETYGIDGIDIGTVEGTGVGECGLLLNRSINAEIGLVTCNNCGTGTGYAAFRMANRNGRIGSAYPDNIRVGEVYARGGGRGMFCVSESGGAVIDRVDIASTGSNAVLLENCYNVTIAADSGTIQGPGDFRIAARTDFANSSDITISNLTFISTTLNENPCGTNTTVTNNVFQSSTDNSCN